MAATEAAMLFNMEMIIVELLQAIVGSFGILLAIPLTSFICAAIYPKHKHGKPSISLSSLNSLNVEKQSIPDSFYLQKQRTIKRIDEQGR